MRTNSNTNIRRFAGKLGAAAILAGVFIGAAPGAGASNGFDLPQPLLDAAKILEMQARDASELTLQEVTLEALAAGAEAGVPERRFSVNLGGAPATAVLTPYDVRHHDAVAYEDIGGGELVQIELPESRTWRGTVEGHPGMVVAATLHEDDSITALMHDPFGDDWAIEPLAAQVPGLPSTMHAVYRDTDIRHDGSSKCGTTPAMRIAPGPGDANWLNPFEVERERALLGHQPLNHPAAGLDSPDGGPEGGSSSQAQIAFDADHEYYLARGNSASTILDIETVMNAVGLIYQNQAGICYAATGYIIRVSSNDPYSSSDSEVRLNTFRDEWNSNVTIPRDMAHLFTGENMDGSTIGLAWVGVVCGDFAYGLSESTYSTNFTNRTQLTAHELGHNFDACHCNQSGCTGGGSDSDCGIMNSFVNGSLDFGSRSLASIEAHRSSRSCLGTCRSTTFVDLDWTGLEFGTQTFPWNTFREGSDYAKINSVVLIESSSRFETGTWSKPLTIDIDGTGSATIGDN